MIFLTPNFLPLLEKKNIFTHKRTICIKPLQQILAQQVSANNKMVKSMECNSMVSMAAFGHGDPGSNPGWFAISNSNPKLSFQE